MGLLAPALFAEPCTINSMVCVHFTRLDNLGSITGKGSTFDIWMVGIWSNQPKPVKVDMVRIMALASGITRDPGNLGMDLVTRQENAAAPNVTIRVIDTLTPMIATGLTTYGLVKKQNIQTYAGLGAGVVAFLRAELKSRAANPEPYFPELCPEERLLGPIEHFACGIVTTRSTLREIGPLQLSLPIQ